MLKQIRPLYLLLYLTPLMFDIILLYTYLDNGIIYWLDSNYPFSPLIWLRKTLFYYWNYPFFPGAPLYYSQDSLFMGIIIFLLYNIFHFSLELSEFIYLLLFIYLSQVGFVKLLNIIFEILEKRYSSYFTLIAGLLGGFIYSWGFYSYTPPILGVNYPFFIFYMLFPLVLYFSIKYIFKEKVISFSLIILYLILASGTQFTEFTYLLWSIVLYLFTVVPIWLLSRKPSFVQFTVKNLVIALIVIVAGLEQLYQTYNASIGAYQVGVHGEFLGKPIVISETEAQYKNFPLSSFISLYSPEKYEIIGVLIFVLIFATILFIKGKTGKFFASLLFLLLIIGGSSTGIINVLPLYSLHSTPIGFIAIGLMYSIQYIFSGFPVSFVSSLIIGYTLLYILEYLGKRRNYIKILFILIILLLSLSYIYSFRAGEVHPEIRAFNLPVNATNIFYPPPELVSVGNYLSVHDEFYNVIEFPMQYAAGMYDDNGTKAVWYTIYPLSDYIMGQVIKSPANSAIYPIYKYFPAFNITNITNYFVLLGAKYIVLNKQEYPGPGVPLGYAGGYPWNYTKFIEALARTPNITLVMENSYYNVYMINLNVSLLYPSEGLAENLSSDQLFFLYANNMLKAQKQSVIYGLGAINITNISGVHIRVVNDYCNEVYEIQVNASRPFYLVFDEGYSPLWEVTINGEINTHHYIANGYANAWLMPAGNYVATLKLSILQTVHITYLLVFLGFIILVLIYVLQRFKIFRYFKNY